MFFGGGGGGAGDLGNIQDCPCKNCYFKQVIILIGFVWDFNLWERVNLPCNVADHFEMINDILGHLMIHLRIIQFDNKGPTKTPRNLGTWI